MTDYEGQARRELLAEDAAAFQKRVEVRAAKLREADQQMMADRTANFPVIRRPARRRTTRRSPTRRGTTS